MAPSPMLMVAPAALCALLATVQALRVLLVLLVSRHMAMGMVMVMDTATWRSRTQACTVTAMAIFKDMASQQRMGMCMAGV